MNKLKITAAILALAFSANVLASSHTATVGDAKAKPALSPAASHETAPANATEHEQSSEAMNSGHKN